MQNNTFSIRYNKRDVNVYSVVFINIYPSIMCVHLHITLWYCYGKLPFDMSDQIVK